MLYPRLTVGLPSQHKNTCFKVLSETIALNGTVGLQDSLTDKFLALSTSAESVESTIDSGTWNRSLNLEADRALVQAETRYALEFRGVKHG